MRNSGWYVPYWRKPKKKGRAESPSTEDVQRSEEQLEAVRRRWVERYRRTLHALRALGLSMGSNRAEVQARYELLRAARAAPDRDVEDAYRYLVRVLPPLERRKRRTRGNGGGAFPPAASPPVTDAGAVEELTVSVVEVHVDGEDDETEFDEESDEGDDEPALDAGVVGDVPLNETPVEPWPGQHDTWREEHGPHGV